MWVFDEAKLLSKNWGDLPEFKLSIVVTAQRHCRTITTKADELFVQSVRDPKKNS
jgi:hypothetical protein